MVIDILVIAVLLISSIIAFARGFIREVLTILGVVGGLAAAYLGGPYAKIYAREWLGVQEGVEPERLLGVVPYNIVADALAYGSIFIIVVILLSVISHMLAEAVKNLGLGAIDRTFGVVFGMARAAVLLGLLYLPVYMFVDDETKQSWFADSKTHVYLEQIADVMSDYLPEPVKKKAEVEFKKMQEEGGSLKEKLDLLSPPQGVAPAEPETAPESAPATAPSQPAQQEGYSDEDRNKMDALIESATGQQPAQPSPATPQEGQGAQ
jgi:membrane protein required for colicin V production